MENIWQHNMEVKNEVISSMNLQSQDDQTLSSDLECDLAHHFDLLESGTLVLLQNERNVSENLKDTSGENDEEDFH